MMIHTSAPKSKKRKPNAKQRELLASWEQIVSKHSPKKVIAVSPTRKVQQVYRRETPNYPSANLPATPCTKPEAHKYTGDKMLGIGTLHKSNAVPVFSESDAVEISRMRRG